MYTENKLKIIVDSNIPSNQALQHFQKKLYQLQKTNEATQAANANEISKRVNQ